jgi:glucosamine-6-phosphate deaminase
MNIIQCGSIITKAIIILCISTFDHIDIKAENINIPDGTVSIEEIKQYCIDYEIKIKNSGGLDFQLLGIGRTGHVGFNEPGSHINSGTRIITLDHITRVDASSDFNGTANVPKIAITMGFPLFCCPRELFCAWGQNKADIIKRTIQEDISAEVPLRFAESCKYHFCFRPISSIRIDPI